MILGVGLDLAEVRRFRFDLARAAWFERRIFTALESGYARGKRRPEEHLAGCFAAKEALRKALGRAIPWRDIGVAHAASGAPTLELSGAARLYADERGVASIHLTITHTARDAAAVVILESA